jgi:hypothetical protein
MQDDPPYYSPSAFVYVGEHAFMLEELWSGVERLKRRGVSLAAIGRALSQDWEMSVIALARLGRRQL